VGELCKLIAVCRDHLPEVEAPCLIIHGSEDPIADPQSADVVYGKIGSAVKERVIIEADYHNLVQRNGRDEVFRAIQDFLDGQAQGKKMWHEVNHEKTGL
jgi:esterase/lipase